MATPTSPQSRLLAAGFKKAATWKGTVTLGATDEILLAGPSGVDVPAIPIDPALESDTPFVKKSELLQSPPVDAVISSRLRYEMGAIGRAIAMIFGTAGTPTKVSTTLAWKHVFQWADDITGLYGTYCEERPSKVYEAGTAKPFRLELNFSNGILMANLSLRCLNWSDAGENGATQMDALTLPANFYDAGVQATFNHAAVKMNTEAGGDVASETKLEVSDFSIVYERPIEAGVHVSGSNTIIEPIEEGHSGPGITITLNFPRMNAVNNTFYTSFIGGTEQKLLINLQGALIEETYYYNFGFFFPRMKMQSPTYPAEDIVKAGLVLQAEQAASAPTGMDYMRPYAEITNKQQTDYLA